MKSLTKVCLTALSASCFWPLVQGAPLFSLGENVTVIALGDAAVTYESNLFRQESDESDDFFYTIAPGVKVEVGSGAFSGDVTYIGTFREYDSWGELSDFFNDIRAAVKYDSGALLAKADFRYYEAANNDVDGTRTDGFLIERDVTSLGLSAKYVISDLTAFSVGASNRNTDYKSGAASNDYYAVPFTFFYRIQPKLDLTAGYTYGFTHTYDNKGNIEYAPSQFAYLDKLEYNDHAFRLGVDGELFMPKLRGGLEVGYLYRDVVSNIAALSDESYETPFVQADVRWYATPNFLTYLQAGNTFQSSSSLGQSYTSTSLELGANLKVAKVFLIDGNIQYMLNDYDVSGRTDDIYGLGTGVAWVPNEYVRVRAGYDYVDNTSNQTFAEYTNHTVNLTVSLKY